MKRRFAFPIAVTFSSLALASACSPDNFTVERCEPSHFDTGAECLCVDNTTDHGNLKGKCEPIAGAGGAGAGGANAGGGGTSSAVGGRNAGGSGHSLGGIGGHGATSTGGGGTTVEGGAPGSVGGGGTGDTSTGGSQGVGGVMGMGGAGAPATDGAPPCVQQTYYLDVDGDGLYPDSSPPQMSCDKPAGDGWTTVHKDPGDCDDNDKTVGTAQTWFLDVDGDTYSPDGAMPQTQCSPPAGPGWGLNPTMPGDCNDNDTTVHTVSTWYLDFDQDGYSPGDGAGQLSCSIPGPGWTLKAPVHGGGDCQDARGDINPSITDFHAEAYKDTSGNNSWDWNCDGILSLETPIKSSSVATCVVSPTGFCFAPSAYLAPTSASNKQAPCGDKLDSAHCSNNTAGKCSPDPVATTIVERCKLLV